MVNNNNKKVPLIKDTQKQFGSTTCHFWVIFVSIINWNVWFLSPYAYLFTDIPSERGCFHIGQSSTCVIGTINWNKLWLISCRKLYPLEIYILVNLYPC